MAIAGLVTIFDQVVASGDLDPDILGDAFKFPVVAAETGWTVWVHHAGLGAAAVGVIDLSPDGVNWVLSSVTLTLTATTPTTVIVSNSTVGIQYMRVRIAHGGANGGRVTVVFQGGPIA